MLYLINYTLGKPEDSYAPLWNALDEMGAERLITPQFVVRQNGTAAKDIQDRFRRLVGSRDHISVNCLSS